MKSKHTELSRYTPPGIDPLFELKFFLCGIICAAIYSLFVFLIRLFAALNLLYDYETRELIRGAVMTDYYLLTESLFIGFTIVAICMLALIIYHYAYHNQHSKSIYLMKRLPDPFELHRRCISLPIISTLLCAACVFLLTLLFFLFYLLVTPKECLAPDQIQKLLNI
ncbi:MAG: hypothetical protein E7665_05175 [Ruminococcaceae bacterium]|nr:hypothetical protein [Oscillospiraceae bacterium]